MLRRIYSLVIIIVVLAVVITGLVAFDAISQYNDEVRHRYLLAMAKVIERDLQNGDTPEASAENALQIYAADHEPLRVTVVDHTGLVLYDNTTPADQMDNHLNRPEISHAIRSGQSGSAIRSSTTVGFDMLYLAHYNPQLKLVIRTAMPLNQHRAGMFSFISTAVIVLLLVMLALGIIGAVMVRYLTRPLARMREAAQEMTQGDLRARVPYSGNGSSEIGLLSQSFNEMAEKLEQNVEELADRNARLDAILDAMEEPVIALGPGCAVTFMNSHARTIFGRSIDPSKAIYPLVLITHSQQTEELAERAMSEHQTVDDELTLTTEFGDGVYHIVASPILSGANVGAIMTFHDISQAQRVQKMRSDFVANVTHELRTPLTSIRGFIETLRAGAIADRSVADRFLDIIDIEAERLHQLINDILILSEIETIREDKDREDFDLNELLDNAAVLLDDHAVEQQVSILIDSHSEPLMVNASRHRIKQILINLIDNAIKYNHPGGKVYVSAHHKESGLLELVVRDTGAGIAPEHQERVFERFYRVDKSRSREMGGTGLGLSIVKHIAQLYHGQAQLESMPGEGSTFRVELDI